MNDIVALPLSILFIAFLAFNVMAFYMIFVHDKTRLALMFSFGVATMLVLLMVAATVGDAYWAARATLLRPDLSLGLLEAIGRDEQIVFARSLRETQLGLDIVNVCVTTNKVLYVCFSLLIFSAYIIPK